MFLRSGLRKGSDRRAELSKDEEAVSKPRIFLHNPLHDYESVWWIAVWFVFHCEPEGVAKHVMERARNVVYRDRFETLRGGGVDHASMFLPVALQPLCEVLVKIGDTLIDAYESFEGSFDGSKMLLVFEELRGHLLVLEERAKGLAIKSPTQSRTLDAEEMEQFDVFALEEKRGRQTVEHDGGAGGQPTVANDPSTGVQHEDVVLGKRARADLSSEADCVLRSRTNQR